MSGHAGRVQTEDGRVLRSISWGLRMLGDISNVPNLKPHVKLLLTIYQIVSNQFGNSPTAVLDLVFNIINFFSVAT